MATATEGFWEGYYKRRQRGYLRLYREWQFYHSERVPSSSRHYFRFYQHDNHMQEYYEHTINQYTIFIKLINHGEN